jgi:creatinine amidohydrolase
MSITEAKVRWEEMFPDEILARQAEYPLVYLPLGMCEPHGPHCALGLDGIKAHEICLRAAHKFGGVVAPITFWQIHETGYHATWGAGQIGEVNGFMTSLPPWVLLRLFLYQLRAIAGRGFHAILAVTGHYGGNQNDLRRVVAHFSRRSPVQVSAWSDDELIDHPVYHGDHAGATETSQLMALRPELVDMQRLDSQAVARHLYAAGPDAPLASAGLGEEIVASQMRRIGEIGRKLLADYAGPAHPPLLSIDDTEAAWRDIIAERASWVTLQLEPGQKAVEPGSVWHANQFPAWPDGG